MQQVGAQVQVRREELKLSMRAAARSAGISPTAWSDLERGKHPPTPDTQRRVARALRWTIDWFNELSYGRAPRVVTEGGEGFEERMRAKAAENPQYIYDDTIRLKQRVTKHEARIEELERQLREVGELVRDLAERLLQQDADAESHPDESRTAR
jgi:transcriptional regulator with XRE-family HTH domain